MQTATLTLALPANVSVAEAQFFLALKLYEAGKLSIGKAAELSGLSYRAFLDRLGEYKVPIFNYPASDLEKELE
jgi:predicted HTH domain antitoxin